MKIIQWIILLIIVIAIGYIIGLNVVNVVDKRLANISINIPKQDLVLKTEIDDSDKILINGQFIGELKGLKFFSGTLSDFFFTGIIATTFCFMF